MMRANVGSQLLMLGCLPILTRLFSPEDFGIAALFNSLLAITSSICIWKFDRAMPNAHSNTHAALLMFAGLSFLVLYCTTITLLLVWSPSFFSLWEGFNTLGTIVLLLPVALLLTGLQLAHHGWFVRLSDMGPVSTARWIYALAYLGASMLLGLAGYTLAGMVVGIVVALLCSALFLSFSAKTLYTNRQRFSWERFQIVVFGSAELTSQSSVVALVNTLSRSCIIIFLAQLFSTEQVGQFALMLRLAITPIRAITASIALSFWARAAELARSKAYKTLKRLYFKLLGSLAVVATAIIAGCLLSPYFLVPVLGSQWQGADQVLIAIIPMLAGTILFSSTNHLVVLDMQRFQLLADISRIVLIVAVFFFSQYTDLAFIPTLALMATASMIGHVLLFVYHLVAYRRVSA